jgi:pectate lyase
VLLALLVALTLGSCRWPGAPRDQMPGPGHEPLEGFGSATTGGAGGRVITVRDPAPEALRKAFHEAAAGHVIIQLDVKAPIVLTKMLPQLTAPGVTIEGGGATIDGSQLQLEVALIDIRTHDVIVRDLRLRNGYDNLRVQGPEAHDIVITHVSSTGARDDGISVGYGAHDVTVQYTFLAGNTRSFFCKYEDVHNVSLHHSWLQKGWIRSPLFSGPGVADVRNVIVEDWGMWGSRFENGASGNVVGSLFTLSPHAVSIGGKGDSALRFVKAGPVYVDGNAFREEAEPVVKGTASAPIAAPPVHTLTVGEMEPLVRARAGCLPRDAVDGAYVALRQGWTVGKSTPFRIKVTR